MGTFASGIAGSSPRIVTLHDIEITPGPPGAAALGPSELTLEVTAKTYRYLDDEEQAAAATEQAKNRKRKPRG